MGNPARFVARPEKYYPAGLKSPCRVNCHFGANEIARPRALYATRRTGGRGASGMPDASGAVFYRMPLLMQTRMAAGRKEKAPRCYQQRGA